MLLSLKQSSETLKPTLPFRHGRLNQRRLNHWRLDHGRLNHGGLAHGRLSHRRWGRMKLWTSRHVLIIQVRWIHTILLRHIIGNRGWWHCCLNRVKVLLLVGWIHRNWIVDHHVLLCLEWNLEVLRKEWLNALIWLIPRLETFLLSVDEIILS